MHKFPKILTRILLLVFCCALALTGLREYMLWRLPIEQIKIPVQGKIDKLVDDDKITPAYLCPQAPAGTGSKDVGYPLVLKGPDISPVVHLGRAELMPAAMPGKNDYLNPVYLADRQGR